jgi:hypothetical protein
MKQRPRIHYTESQKALMWERWQKGDSLQQIAQLFDRNHSSIQAIRAATGGIRPAPRCRSRLALTLSEREEISRAGCGSYRAFDSRAPSTISREIKGNEGQEGYRASQADQCAWARGRRPKISKLAHNRALARIVAEVTTLFPGAASCHTAPPQGDSLYLGKSAPPGLTLGWDRLGGRLHLTISRCVSALRGQDARFLGHGCQLDAPRP